MQCYGSQVSRLRQTNKQTDYYNPWPPTCLGLITLELLPRQTGPCIHHTCKLNTGIHNFPTHWITALMLVTKLLSSYLSPWVWLPGEHTWRRECAGQWCTCLGSRSERKHVTTPSNSSARTDSEEKTLFFETRALNNDIIIMTKTTYSKVPQNNAKAASATATCTQIRLFTSIH